MRKALLALSLMLPALALAPVQAEAQGVYIGAGPLGIGLGNYGYGGGSYYGSGYSGYGSGYSGYGPGYYGYGAPYRYRGYRSYRPTSYYGYGPAVRYRTRAASRQRVTSYYSAPQATARTSVTTVSRAPGNCGTYFYWDDGRCVDARMKSSR